MFKDKILVVAITLFAAMIVVIGGLWVAYYVEKINVEGIDIVEGTDVPVADPGRKIEQSKATVDKLATKATFYLMWESDKYGADDFIFKLKSPLGTEITADIVDAGVNVHISDYGDSYQVIAPEPGVWEIIVDAPEEARVTTSQSLSSSLRLEWEFVDDKPRVGDPLVVEAKLIQPELVQGGFEIELSAKKYKQGTKEHDEYNMFLRDDGRRADRQTGDGIYTVVIEGVTEQIGSCCVEITAKGSTDKAGNFSRFSRGCTYVRE